MDCLFANSEVATFQQTFIMKDNDVIAFEDIMAGKQPSHFLVIPKRI